MNLLRWFPYKVRLLFDPTINNINITVYSASLGDDAVIAVRQLERVRDELRSALTSVESLRIDAVERSREADALRQQVAALGDDRKAAEAVLRLPEEAVTRLVARANRCGAWRGRLEGAAIGFLTGVVSSYLVWWLTR